MPPLLSKRIIRSRVTVGAAITSTQLVDVATAQTIETYRGNATAFEFGFFSPGGAVLDLSDVETLNLRIRESQTSGSALLADQTLEAADLDLTLDEESWADGTKQHAGFVFSNAEMNLDPAADRKSFWLVITAFMADGSEVTLSAGAFVIHEDNNTAADPPPENPGTAITLEEADARYRRASDPVSIAAADISDSGATGRDVVKAATKQAARVAINVGDDPTQFHPGTITRIIMAGDSITATALGTSTQNAKLWPWWLITGSGREFVHTPNGSNMAFAASGDKLTNFITTYLPAILALNPKPSHCILQYGTNDSGAYPVMEYIVNYESVIDALRAGGIEPIIMTPPQAPPYSGYASDILNATRGSLIAEMTDALVDLCIAKGVCLVDPRKFLESNLGESPRGTNNEGDLLGLHPATGWHFVVAQNLARKLIGWGAAGTDAFSYTPINAQPNIETTTPTIAVGTNQTATTTLVPRVDGAGGNLLQVILASNGTKQIGTGDTGVLFAPKTGFNAKDYDVSIITENGYLGVGGVAGSPTTIPAVAVERIRGTNRRLLLIKPARPVTTFTTPVQEIIDAVNAHPEASQFLTATAVGTPGSNLWPASNLTTAPTTTATTPDPGTPTAAENLIADTDQVRGIVEVWHPKGAIVGGVTLMGRAAYGTGAFATIATLAATGNHTPICPLTGRCVYVTPWVTVGTYRRLQVRATFGGAEGYYRLGRARVQVRTP